MRKFLGIVLGLFVAAVIFYLSIKLEDALYPVSIDVDFDQIDIAALIAQKSVPDKLLWVMPWALGSFAGAWLALRVSDWKWAGWIVSLLVLVFNVFNGVDLPFWMQVCAVVLPLLGGWIARALHHKPYPGEPLLG